MTEKIERLAELVRHTPAAHHPSARAVGRNAFTRAVDHVLLWIRHRVPPLHWLGAALSGLALYIYACLAGKTSRIVAAGARKWPDIPERSVLAIWHDSAPSLLAAIASRKPPARLVILIATEPRGDSLHILCRLLGMRVVRGDWGHRGWPSVAHLAELAAGGACVLITPDGGGPRRTARAGALVLAAAAGVPLIAIGADCHPALSEPHKWDQPRNPPPFCRIAISIQPPLDFADFENAAALESARLQLEQALNEAHSQARRELGLSKPE
ncbi:MAG TPA: hypothetical protein VEV17_22580 [Bryobacteraceae bacterium]|nr:hypothetical protein [Bryobacteraceae bacterium]